MSGRERALWQRPSPATAPPRHRHLSHHGRREGGGRTAPRAGRHGPRHLRASAAARRPRAGERRRGRARAAAGRPEETKTKLPRAHVDRAQLSARHPPSPGPAPSAPAPLCPASPDAGASRALPRTPGATSGRRAHGAATDSPNREEPLVTIQTAASRSPSDQVLSPGRTRRAES